MIQHVIILILFVAAAAYMVRLLYITFFNKEEGCARSCGACSTVDFKKIEQEMQKRKQAALPKV